MVSKQRLAAPAIYSSVSVSPDKKYLLIEKIDKPFSYFVTAFGFNSTMLITDMNANTDKSTGKITQQRRPPRGNDNVLNAPRGYDWLDNSPATVKWIEPLDSGLIKKKMDYHDAAYTFAAPFTGAPKELVKTAERMYNVTDVTNDPIFCYRRFKGKAPHKNEQAYCRW